MRGGEGGWQGRRWRAESVGRFQVPSPRLFSMEASSSCLHFHARPRKERDCLRACLSPAKVLRCVPKVKFHMTDRNMGDGWMDGCMYDLSLYEIEPDTARKRRGPRLPQKTRPDIQRASIQRWATPVILPECPSILNNNLFGPLNGNNGNVACGNVKRRHIVHTYQV